MIDSNNCSVNELAQLVNVNKKKSMSQDYMVSALAYVKSASEKVQLNVDPFCGKNLTFSNGCQFPLYQVDFGQGIPKRVAFPLTPLDGCILIIPTSTDEVELFICLREEHANHLRKRLEPIRCSIFFSSNRTQKFCIMNFNFMFIFLRINETTTSKYTTPYLHILEL
jgi:hypothetical protein